MKTKRKTRTEQEALQKCRSARALHASGQSGRGWAMSPHQISKVGVGCRTFEALRKRQEARLSDGVVPITTRFRPTRADELIGGSIYWIVKHRLAARQTILGFADGEDRRTIIRLDPKLVPVRARRSEEHTSELQSLMRISYAVFCLKKKKRK